MATRDCSEEASALSRQDSLLAAGDGAPRSIHRRTRSHDPVARPIDNANYSFDAGSLRGTKLLYKPPESLEELEQMKKEAQIAARLNLGMSGTFTLETPAVPETIGKDLSRVCAKDIVRIMSTAKKGRCEGKILDTHKDYYESEENIGVLENGGHLFSFTCRTPANLSPHEIEMVDCIVNLSSFPDETVENGVPLVNVHDDVDRAKYTYILQKCAYILPSAKIGALTPKYVSSYDYQFNSQPKSSYIWPASEVSEENTFRFTKTIVRFIFSLTMQMKVSVIDAMVLPSLSALIGTKVSYGLLMERTKRNASKGDSTAKAKSLLLYTEVDGGLLCTNITVALQTAIPSVVASLMTSFGSMGSAEVAETAANTRNFILHGSN
jgi:hypothetical protein